MNTQMYAFALRNTTENHIRCCVVKTLYPTLPRFQSKMAIVWDRSMSERTAVPSERTASANERTAAASERTAAASFTCDRGSCSVVFRELGFR